MAALSSPGYVIMNRIDKASILLAETDEKQWILRSVRKKGQPQTCLSHAFRTQGTLALQERKFSKATTKKPLPPRGNVAGSPPFQGCWDLASCQMLFNIVSIEEVRLSKLDQTKINLWSGGFWLIRKALQVIFVGVS